MSKILWFYFLFEVLLVSGALSSNSVNEVKKTTNHKRYKRTVGGTPGKIEDFQFLVSISIKFLKLHIPIHSCGGSIISPNIVLTAGHCTNFRRFRDTKPFKVHAGSSFWRKGGETYDVKKIIAHENYNNTVYTNDISILILTKNIIFNKYINSIPIATKLRLPGTNCLTFGWGYTKEDDQKLSEYFNVVDVPIFDFEVCRNIYSSSNLTESVICAGHYEGGKDACTFDSGGPLIEGGELIGIISLGSGCGQPQRPGVYTNVFYMRDWIIKNLIKYSVSI